nr:MAG TPA: hypothetical protein [Caudoviricetes sp.]
MDYILTLAFTLGLRISWIFLHTKSTPKSALLSLLYLVSKPLISFPIKW